MRIFKNDYMVHTKDELELLSQIEIARVTLDSARNYFQIVVEPRLIDYAIFMEEAARIKYMYLLFEAKKKGIVVNVANMPDVIRAV
ncbi:MAG TPA: YaaL family protein [Clostridiaceae bacterium]